MIRNLKTLGLALVAVFAMSAVAASAASAIEFHSESENTTLTGKQVEQHIFTVAAGTIKCTKATFTGTTTAKTVKEITITPLYQECTLAGAAATVDFVAGGCDYSFKQPATLTTGKVAIVCTKGVVTVKAPTCEVTVKGQEVGTVAYSNTGAGATREVDLTANVAAIAYEQIGTKCLGNGGAPSKAFATGTYKGTALVTGEVTGTETHTGVWVE